MASSRGEKLGSVFSRIQGLLRAGAIQEAEKPVWYDVFAAFPPRVEPNYERFQLERAPVNILYKEDFIRAKFYNTFASPDLIDMTREDDISLSQRFIEKYRSLESQTPGEEPGKLFQSVTEAMKADGFMLRSFEELEKEKATLKKTASQDRGAAASFSDSKTLLSDRIERRIQELDDAMLEDDMEPADYEPAIEQDREPDS